MNKYVKVFLIIAAVLVIIILAFFVSGRIDVSQTERIIIQGDTNSGLHSFTVEIESFEVQKLKEIFNGKKAYRDTPSCPYGGVKKYLWLTKKKPCCIPPEMIAKLYKYKATAIHITNTCFCQKKRIKAFEKSS